MKKIILLALLLISPAINGQELVNLTTPIVRPSTTNYQVTQLVLNWELGSINVTLKSNTGDILVKNYDGSTNPTGASLMISLNKANLTARSLNQRIFDRLVLDGVVVGTVAGSVP